MRTRRTNVALGRLDRPSRSDSEPWIARCKYNSVVKEERSMESFRFRCSNCGKELEALSNQTAVRCERCGVAILIEDVLDDASREDQAESSSPQNRPNRPWPALLAVACLMIAVIVCVCVALSRRTAKSLDEDAVPVPTSETADAIGDDAIGPSAMDETEVDPDEEESIGSRVVDQALTKLGCPYVYGKKGSEEFDCSGLVYWAISQEDPALGERMYTNAAGQAKYCYDRGLLVEKSELQPGDLVFWVYKKCKGCHRWKEIHHVGIYAGDGKVIEAAGDKECVVIRKLWKTKDCPIIFYARPYA